MLKVVKTATFCYIGGKANKKVAAESWKVTRNIMPYLTTVSHFSSGALLKPVTPNLDRNMPEYYEMSWNFPESYGIQPISTSLHLYEIDLT